MPVVRAAVSASRKRRSLAIAVASAAAATLASSAHAQVATLDKGHSLLVNNGLQVWGLVTDSAFEFNYGNMAAANFDAVTWSFGASNPGVLSAGQKWGKWTDHTGNPATALNATEQAHFSDMVTLQVGDEQQGDLESPTSLTTQWFQAAHAGNYFPNQLLTVNSFFINSDAAYANFIANANPDAISWDGYPFSVPAGTLITPQNWLVNANRFRRHALGSYIGATGNAPRPYGMYLQTYHAGDGARDPGDVEMRWQQFTAWTLGYKFVDAFTAGGGNTSLFREGNQSLPMDGSDPLQSPPRYNWFKETARQSHNLGTALTRLISYGEGPSIVPGKNSAGVTNGVPGGWLSLAKTNAPPNQQFLTSLSATNAGTKNNGQPGDVYVGFFNPLHASFGEPGDVYFMVTNALGAYLDDPTATVADTQQQITMNFDTQYSGVSTLQRLRRSDGQIEIVPLTRTTGRLYQHQFTLEGGTGDLFKYNDGSPFVGFNNTLHWDNDGNSSGNNTGTGAGLGGGGTWDGPSNKWYNGSSNGAWGGNRDAVFTGTPGTVTLASPQSVNSLAFKSNGYSLTGSALTMAGQHITTDSGVTTTIGSTIAGTGGIVKAGPGTLHITNNANTYTGGTAVTGGVLQISADGAMGPAPGTFMGGDIILNGGTLRFGANFDIANTRGIDIGPGGGTIDTQGFSNPAGYNAFQGGFRGPGDLTKVGSGTFFAAATTGGANTQWKGRLIIKEGTWKIVASDGLPYNMPLPDGLKADQVTLDGGTWQAGATMNITNARRGITVDDGGGTIDTQNFNLTWAGPLAGNAASTLNKTGSGVLRFTGVTFASTYNGNVNVNGGTLQLDNGKTMGDLASINLANVAGATLNITDVIPGDGVGNEIIGSLAGGGASGGSVVLSGAVTLTTGANNASTTFAGGISGSGHFAKTGAGVMNLSGGNTYTGTTSVSQGTLLVNGTHTGAGDYAVAAGAMLGGTGAITLAANTNSVTVNGVLAPGASIESLNINTGDLTLGGAATSNFEIDLSTGTFDQVNVGDLLTYGGVLNVTFTGSDADGGTFQIFTFGDQTGDFSSVTFTGLAPSQTASFDESTGIVTVVPEPAALGLLTLGMLGMRRRRC